jgi:hypothetical protein
MEEESKVQRQRHSLDCPHAADVGFRKPLVQDTLTTQTFGSGSRVWQVGMHKAETEVAHICDSFVDQVLMDERNG